MKQTGHRKITPNSACNSDDYVSAGARRQAPLDMKTHTGMQIERNLFCLRASDRSDASVTR
jgi:hypothetical protein